MLAITLSGKKEVINLQIGENESSKYWLGIQRKKKH
jgi:putative transposase